MQWVPAPILEKLPTDCAGHLTGRTAGLITTAFPSGNPLTAPDSWSSIIEGGCVRHPDINSEILH